MERVIWAALKKRLPTTGLDERWTSFSLEGSAETSAPRTPQPERGHKKGGPVNGQYIVLFTQRMIKVP